MKRKAIEDCPIKPVEYFWYPYVPFGMTSVFQGQAGLGKTSVLSKLFAEASHGLYPPRLHKRTIKGRAILTDWQKEAIEHMRGISENEDIQPEEIEKQIVGGIEVDGIDDDDYELEKQMAIPMDRPFMRFRGEPIKMVYISRENEYGNIIRQKYEEFGGRPGFLTVIDETDRKRFTTTEDNIRFITGDAKLVVIDPIFPFMDGRLSSNDDLAVTMENFDIVARETGAAYVLINNLNKNGSSADVDRGLGGSNLKNIARSLFHIDREGKMVYIEGLKNNNAPYHGRIGVLFDAVGRPDFIQYRQLEAALKQDEKAEEGNHKRAKELQRAVDFFHAKFDAGQVYEHSKIKKMMIEEHISISTMNRAKKMVGVISAHDGDRVIWKKEEEW